MHFKMLSAICFNLDQSKILLSGNGLIMVDWLVPVYARHLHWWLYPPQWSGVGYTGIPMAVRWSVSGHNFVQSFSPTVLHVLLWNLYIMFVYIWSSACLIFMTILSLVVELSTLELVNFSELLLSREIILLYCMYWTQSYTQCYW